MIGQQASGASGGGRAPFPVSSTVAAVSRRHRSLFSFDGCNFTIQEAVKRTRSILLVGIGLAAMSLPVWLLPVSSTSPKSYESLRTKLFFQAARGSRYVGFDEVSKYFSRKCKDSRSRDLYEAVTSGLVSRVRFTKQHSNFGSNQSVALLLRKWGFANGVQILGEFVSGDELIILVLASEEKKVTNYLSSLTTDKLRPLE